MHAATLGPREVDLNSLRNPFFMCKCEIIMFRKLNTVRVGKKKRL